MRRTLALTVAESEGAFGAVAGYLRLVRKRVWPERVLRTG
jgi:hypothetical protein